MYVCVCISVCLYLCLCVSTILYMREAKKVFRSNWDLNHGLSNSSQIVYQLSYQNSWAAYKPERKKRD